MASKRKQTMYKPTHSERVNICSDINAVLKHYGLPVVDLDDFSVGPNVVTDDFLRRENLSARIIGGIWPSIDSGVFYHFTTRKKAQSIISDGAIRLYSVAKRDGQGEFKELCEALSLHGYMADDQFGNPVYRDIINDIYYMSLVETSLSLDQEDYLQSVFSRSGGARVKMKIRASNNNLRRIVYSEVDDKPVKILKDMSDVLREKHKKYFILSGISRLCAFYLPGDLKIECEVRMLYVNHAKIQPENDGKWDYFSIRFGTTNHLGYLIEDVDVEYL